MKFKLVFAFLTIALVSCKNEKKEVKDNDISDVLSLEGVCDFPEKELQKSALFFHPTKQESFGLVLLEAMACGAVCFSTDGVGNRVLIEDKVNGFFFYHRDPLIIMEKMMEVLANEELYLEIQQAGLEFVKAYGIKDYSSNLIKLYRLKLN